MTNTKLMPTTNSNETTKDECAYNPAQAELPLILLPTFVFNVVAVAVLVRMKRSSESLDRLLVSSLVFNDLLSTSLYIVTVVMGWVSCGSLLQYGFVCSVMGWLTTTMVMWSAGVIAVMTTCR